MPKNKGKGGKTRRRGKKHDDDEKRELSYKEEGQEYALVLRMLGAGRLEAYCYDGKTRQCTIRGNMRRKIWINQGDTILIGLRDFQDDKADVIQKFSPDEALQLKKVGEIPDNAAATAGTDQLFDGDDDVGFDFDDI